MSWTLVLYGLLPLLVFVIVDLFAGVKWGVIAAMACAVADIFITRWLLGEWDPGTIVATVLVIILGGVSIRLDDSRYFKLQPVVLAALFAGFIAYYQTWGGGLAHKYGPLLVGMVPPEHVETVKSEHFLTMYETVVTGMIGVFLVHGALVAFTALKASNVTWLLMRGLGFWVIFGAYGILAFIFMVVKGSHAVVPGLK